MHSFVVDTSVVVKWILLANEKDVEDAQLLYKRLVEKKIRLYAPSFLLVELLNILMKKKRVDAQDASTLAERIYASGIEFVDISAHENIAVIPGLIEKYQVSAYDALFFLVAEQKNCTLITYDEALLKLQGATVSVQEALK